MDTANPQVMPAPPSLMKSLVSGFESVSNHFLLILFPVVIDLVLWFGPKISLRSFLEPLLKQAGDSSSEQLLQGALQKYNLLNAIRSFPVGVPSLMASKNPELNPLGHLWSWNIQAPQSVLLVWIVLTLVGLMIGTLYFLSVAFAATGMGEQGIFRLRYLSGLFFRTMKLTLVWLIILLGLSLPFACAMIFLGIVGIGVGTLAFLPILILAVWFIFPLFFSPHAMILKNKDVFAAFRDSAQVARATAPFSGILILLVLVISEGLDILWKVPAETSWLSLVGVAGHAFINTSLLAATFIYFRDADRWLTQMVSQNNPMPLWQFNRKR